VPIPRTTYKTFAVKVKCIRIDWIIKDPANGISFLQEMVRHKNKDIFNTDYAKIITQYLYKEYSGMLIKRLLPTYIIHQISMLGYLYTFERLRINLYFYKMDIEQIVKPGEYVPDTGEYGYDNIIFYLNFKNIFCILSFTINLVNIYFFVKQASHLGLRMALRLWSYIDLIIIIITTVMAVTVFDEVFEDLPP
jgi:hypothetical protein